MQTLSELLDGAKCKIFWKRCDGRVAPDEIDCEDEQVRYDLEACPDLT